MVTLILAISAFDDTKHLCFAINPTDGKIEGKFMFQETADELATI